MMLNQMRDALAPVARACFPKFRHVTRGAAEAHMRALIKCDLQKNNRLHAYRCPECSAWHVGHH